MVWPFTREQLESRRLSLAHWGVSPDDFIKVVDNLEVFMCPSDNPHPHRINEDRVGDHGGFWAQYEVYGYSYGLNVAVSPYDRTWVMDDTKPPSLDRDASSQVLAGDGTMFELYNFRAGYLEVPDCPWNYPYGFSNSVGYFHVRYQVANLVCRDGSARSVNYGENASGIDTNGIFFWERGESIDR